MNTDYNVIVAGYGPVGAGAANLLGYYKIKSLIIDKEKEIYTLPRAITWDDECRRIIVPCNFADKIEVRKIRGINHINGKGESFLKIRMAEENKYEYQVGPTFMYQPEFEGAFRDNAETYDTNHFKLGFEVLSYEEKDECINVEIKNLDTNKVEHVTTKYLIGADGANSIIRKKMGVKYKSFKYDEPWMCVDGFADQELECFTDVDAFQICDPKRSLTIINSINNKFRFEIMIMPEDNLNEIQKEEVFFPFIAKYLKNRKFTFTRKAIYTFHSTSVNKWKKNNVFLVGDAAHQMPPFMGQGMNSGMRDVENLLWKLSGVISKKYNQGILNTYETERKYHAEKIIKASIAMGNIIMTPSPLKAFFRDIGIKIKSLTKKGKQSFYPGYSGIRLGEGLHNHPTERSHIFRYYFPIIFLKDQNNKTTDDLLQKNFGLILNNFNKDPSVSEDNCIILNKLDFRIINRSNNLLKSNYSKFVCIQSQGKDLDTYFSHFECNAVLIRPDKYVFDIINFNEEDSLDQIMSNIINKLEDKKIL